MSELKCCPFCSSNNIKVGSVGNSLGIDNYIKCVDCGAKIQICDGYEMEHLEELWNRRTPMANIVEKLEEREKYLERAMKENHEKGYSSSETKAMNERVAIRYAINIVKQEINNGLE